MGRRMWNFVTLMVARANLVLLQLWLAGERRLEAQAGQSLVEYALVIALIGVAAIIAIQALSGAITQLFQNLAVKLQSLGR